jgi:preprotein translocase subunit SecG
MPAHHFSPRTQVTANGWAGILIIVILVCAVFFCIGAVLLICKRKRARKQRQQKLADVQSALSNSIAQTYKAPVALSYNAHEYRMVGNGGDYVELGTRGPVELQGGVHEDARTDPQQLDGYAAPGAVGYDGRAVEMPAQTVTR